MMNIPSFVSSFLYKLYQPIQLVIQKLSKLTLPSWMQKIGFIIKKIARLVIQIICSRALRIVILCIISGIILLILSLRLGLWQQSSYLKPYIERLVSNQLNATLTIDTLDTGWDGLTPTLVVNGVALRDQYNNTLFSLAHGKADVALNSLIRFSLHLQQLDLNNISINSHRQLDGTILIAGQKIDFNDTKQSLIPEWLLSTRQVTVNHVDINWQDQLNPNGNIHILIPQLLSQHARHKTSIQMSVDAPVLTSPAQFRSSFTTKLFGKLGNWRDWHGELSWSIPTIDLGKIQEKWHVFPMLHKGLSETTGSIDFAKGEIHTASIRLASTFDQLQLDKSFSVLDIKEIGGVMQYKKQDDHRHQLNISSLNWRYASDNLPENIQEASLTWQTNTEPHHSISQGQDHPISDIEYLGFTLSQINLTSLTRLARSWKLPDKVEQTLTTLQPRGELEKIRGYWQAKSNDILIRHTKPQYAVEMHFKQVGIGAPINPSNSRHSTSQSVKSQSASTAWPSFDGLSGELKLDENHGTLKLESYNSHLVLQNVFDEPIFLRQLTGDLSWDRTTKQLLLSSQRLFFENDDLLGALSGSYAIETAQAELDARIDHLNLATVNRYLPKQVGEDTKHFFSHSKLAGKAHPVRITLHGSLKNFPYTRVDQGVFKIDIPVSKAYFELPIQQDKKTLSTLRWPAFEQIDGLVTLQQDKLFFEIKQAKVLGTSLKKVTGEIIDLYHDKPKLVIKGEASGSSEEFLNFVARSPLAGELTILENLNATGGGKLFLKLDIPLVEHQPYKIDGRYILKNNRIQWSTLGPFATIEGVNAEVQFSEKDFHINRAYGYFASGEFTANGDLYSKQGITFHGSANIADLSKTLDHAPQTLNHYLDGKLKYSGRMRMYKDLPDLRLDSDLTDLNINLPYPLEKTRGNPLAARLHWRKKPFDQHEELSLHIDELIHAQYLLTPDHNGEIKVTNGQIVISNSDHKISQNKHSPVTAQIALDKLDLDKWLEAIEGFSQINPSPEKSESYSISSFLPSEIQAHIGMLTFLDREWGKTTTTTTYNKDNLTLKVDNPHINGNIEWHTPNHQEKNKNVLTVNLQKFHLPETPQTTTKSTFNHVTLPEIHLQVDDIRAFGFHLGSLTLDAHNSHEDKKNIWVLDKFSIKNPHAVLNVTGKWGTTESSSNPQCTYLFDTCRKESAINFRLDIFNGGAFLDDFGISKTLSKGKGKVVGNLNWQGSPLKIDYPSLVGNLQLDLTSGSFLGVDPGAVKLLGIFGLQNIVQLGIFNLRGLTSAGLPFKKINANAKITKGIAHTDDFTLESSIATVSMVGDISLGDATQDLQVKIIPDVNLGSASLAYALVNPLLGVGSLLVQQALKSPLGLALAQYYSVKGPWSNPVITRVSAPEKNP